MGLGISIRTLLCVDGMDNPWGPAVEQGNSSQYSVIVYAGKESERECMCVRGSLHHLLTNRSDHNPVNPLSFNKTFKKETKANWEKNGRKTRVGAFLPL